MSFSSVIRVYAYQADHACDPLSQAILNAAHRKAAYHNAAYLQCNEVGFRISDPGKINFGRNAALA